MELIAGKGWFPVWTVMYLVRFVVCAFCYIIIVQLVLWQIKDQYMRGVSELNQQNAQLQDELKRCKNDLKVASIQVEDLKKVLEELRNEMLLKVTIADLNCHWIRTVPSSVCLSVSISNIALEWHYFKKSRADVFFS